jgi:hypothetical protein
MSYLSINSATVATTEPNFVLPIWNLRLICRLQSLIFKKSRENVEISTFSRDRVRVNVVVSTLDNSSSYHHTKNAIFQYRRAFEWRNPDRKTMETVSSFLQSPSVLFQCSKVRRHWKCPASIASSP